MPPGPRPRPDPLPDRARLARLALAAALAALTALLAVPLARRASAASTAAAFLAEFLTDGARPWLSRRTPAPTRVPRPLPDGGHADLWRPAMLAPWRGLVLVHGLTTAGKDDPRVQAAATLLARGGFAVLVPDLPSLRAQRLRADDARQVRGAIEALGAEAGVDARRLAVVAVSVGLAPATLAAADPAVGSRVGLLVSLGGHAEARELIRYFTTGAYRFGGDGGRAAMDPALVREFVRLNLDLVRDAGDRAAVADALDGRPPPPGLGPEGRAVLALLANRDPERVDALLAALPPETQALLDALSPARHLPRVPARLLLVHGRDDPAVPFTESLRLAAAAGPARSRLALVGVLEHVEGLWPRGALARDLLRLGAIAYELFRG